MSGSTVEIIARDWLSPDADLNKLDRMVTLAERSGDVELTITGSPAELKVVVPQAQLRYQRLRPRANEFSRSHFFENVLAFHRAAYPMSRPDAREAHAHAIDTWQWVLRLRGDASLVVQLAALFHEERGEMVRSVLRRMEAWPLLVEHVAELVEKRGRIARREELALLDDAHGLSFFGRSSAAHLVEYGLERTEEEVERTLAAMSPAAIERLAVLKHPRAVAKMIRRRERARVPVKLASSS